MAVLDGLKPENVFYFFEEISKIPHGSGNTGKISDYLVSFAKKRNLRYIQDEAGNVIIFKEKSAGCENSCPVIIQGHMDMVCEKEQDSDIDFLTSGLRLKTDGEKIWADKTTLGGDDGIAVAIMLSILDADDILHPPIEACFTVDEEIGMLGAGALDCVALKGKTMLNLDSENEGELLVSCAGGATVCGSVSFDTMQLENKRLYKLFVTGGMGGHSGIEIDKKRANASKLLGRVLNAIVKAHDIGLAYIEGGLKDNAIPREAYALLFLYDESELESIKSIVHDLNKIFKNEFAKTDPDIEVMILDDDIFNGYALDNISAKKVSDVLMASPNGIIKMSSDMEGMVQTSLNLGIMKLIDVADNKKELSLSFCVRSSVASEKNALIDKLRSIFSLAGGTLTVSGDYPGWEYKKDSKLRELMVDRYGALFGKKPVVCSVHAGVECGIFADKIEGLDCVSYGPDMSDIHTPNETLYVESVRRTYEFTLDVLRNLC